MRKLGDAGGKLNTTDGEPIAPKWEYTWKIGEMLQNI